MMSEGFLHTASLQLPKICLPQYGHIFFLQLATAWGLTLQLEDYGATNHHYQHRHGHQLQTVVTWGLDELERNQKKRKII